MARIVIFLCLISAVLSLKVQHGKHTRVRKSSEMDEEAMHGRTRPQRKLSSAPLDRRVSSIRDMMDDDVMHPQFANKEQRQEGIPFPMEEPDGNGAGIPLEFVNEIWRQIIEMDDDLVHGDDGHSPFADRDMDNIFGLGEANMERESVEMDEETMHGQTRPKQKKSSASLARMGASLREMMEDEEMHPQFGNREQRQYGIPVPMETPDREDVEIQTELGEDFWRQVDMDDEDLMHGDGLSPSYRDVDDVLRDVQTKKEFGNIDRDIWKDFEKRVQVANSKDLSQEPKRSGSRRLLSLEGDDNVDGVPGRSNVLNVRKTQMNVKAEGKPFFFTRRLNASFGYPLHASCNISWIIGLDCSMVSQALNQQISKWNGPEGCEGGGEKCLYTLVSSNSTMLLATHETPVQHYVDDLSFQFTPQASSSCAVKGFSRSETWYAVLDKGTNYCNLHNLITGSGLDKSVGYKETTNDSICTQYSSADCNVY